MRRVRLGRSWRGGGVLERLAHAADSGGRRRAGARVIRERRLEPRRQSRLRVSATIRPVLPSRKR